MRKIISLICLMLPILAHADVVEIRPDAPDRHIVVKGDTLWDIAAMFYKDPWKWPQIWNINKVSIKDPHWIYPGDVVMLDRADGSLHVGVTGTNAAERTDTATQVPREHGLSEDGIGRLSPRIRSDLSIHDAIPTIPFRAIQPFLSQPLVMEDDAEAEAPILVAFEEERVILGTDQKGYAKGLSEDLGSKWQVYRPGITFVDPDTNEALGREAIYLGDVDVIKFGAVSTVLATKTKQEINRGDFLFAPVAVVANNYLPRAPESDIKATVISIYGGVSQAGQNTVITLNKGERDGLQIGHVLALYNHGKVVKHATDTYALPDERYGLIFVFRIFHKVSYALVMETRVPVQLFDHAQTP
jgi:hypothetical protein